MKKKQATPKAPKRRTSTTPPPIGLLHLFAMVRDDSENPTAAATYARVVYPLASEMLATVFDNDSGRLRYDILKRAEPALFPHLDPPGDAEPEAGFLVGMATAYLLMTRIGGAR